MRIGFLLLLTFLLLAPARAQTGKIGMPGEVLRERLGEPFRTKTDDGGEMWFYRGDGGRMTFGYYLADGVITATDVLITHDSRMQALARIEQVLAEMKKAGWRVVELNANNYLLYAGASVYRVYLLPNREDNALLLSHMRRKEVKEMNGRMRDELLAVHEAGDTLSPDLVTYLAEDTPAASSPPPSSPAPKARAEPPKKTRTETTPETVSQPPAPVESAPKRRADGFSRRGYTWIVASRPSFDEADAVAEKYRRENLPVVVLRAAAGGRTVYRVGVGWHPTQKALDAARSALPAWAPGDAWPFRARPSMIVHTSDGDRATDTPAAASPPPSSRPPKPRAGTPEPPPARRTDAFARRGYTWIVASRPSRDEADAVAEKYRRENFPVVVLRATAGGRTVYRVGVGWHASKRALEDARSALPAWTPGDAWISRVAPSMIVHGRD
ncbi:SPOR domain-containing protein [Rhodocaloribacter sp.]